MSDGAARFRIRRATARDRDAVARELAAYLRHIGERFDEGLDHDIAHWEREYAPPAGVLVYVGQPQNGGTKFVVRPGDNRRNRWFWGEPTTPLRSPSWAKTLRRLPSEGFYTLPDTLELLRHPLVGGDDVIKGVGDLTDQAGLVARQPDGEVADADGLQGMQQVAQIGRRSPVRSDGVEGIQGRCRRAIRIGLGSGLAVRCHNEAPPGLVGLYLVASRSKRR